MKFKIEPYITKRRTVKANSMGYGMTGSIIHEKRRAGAESLSDLIIRISPTRDYAFYKSH